MHAHHRFPLAALVAILACAPSAALAQGFDLPTPTPSPTQDPVYGPVDPERPRTRPVPAPQSPVAVTPTPTARATPTPTPSATRAVVQPVPSPLPLPPVVRREQTRPQVQATQRPGALPADPDQASPEPEPDTAGGPPPQPSPAQGAEAELPPALLEDSEGRGTAWWIALLAVLALIGAGALAWWRRRGGTVESSGVPEIERPEPIVHEPVVPSVPAAPAPAPQKRPEPAKVAPILFAAGTLQAEFEARRITITMMAASLSYTIRLTNRGDAPLSDLMAGGTMEAANEMSPLDAQLRPPSQKLPILHQHETLASGESVEFTGDFRVPLQQLRPIVRGEQVVFLPIARLRAAGAPENGERLLAQDSVLLGVSDQSPALDPIRLDEGPRVYSQIGQRQLAPKAA